MRTTSFAVVSTLFVSCAHALLPPTNGQETRAAARVYTTCTKPKTLAITFDDGPNTYTKTIVDTLDKAGGKATFFFNGKNYNCIYDATNAERAKTNDAIKKITGAAPAFVRPPFGEHNANVQNVAESLGQSLVTWDLDSQDWNGASVSQIESTYKTRIDSNPNGILTLNHEVYAGSAQQVLPWVINYAKSKGYKLVTVAECVGAQPYITKGSPSRRDSSWVC
ncbi:Bifunctional xylanase/deacetylase Includes: RecName: Full=Endo-1,4-beta-xylanase D [Rhizoctonia solani AG-1 IB]|uniref:XynD protein n=1 Tax=Thanatephorus cucumeris (strain AG1-IB / isolate 7/3/14) TaxID=1108050 RepID=M5CB04_THACB|nr:Bifunctional xylanase/deacetylase Includes: RecName: Full=Endo-1,4-beta-xylanase D [Rhizoctonia solani AG-1 IB]